MFAALNSFLTRAVTGYFLNKSLRFRSSASAYLNRTFGTPTNNIKWTWSGWIKRGKVSGYQRIFGVGSDASGIDQGSLTFDTSNVLGFFQGGGGGGTEAYLVTNALYRDPAAWYHIMLVYDSANGTSSSRALLYINGEQVTSFSTATYPSASLASKINASAVAHAIGVLPTSPSNYFDGEMAEVNFVDGQALAPTAFGAFSTYNQWLPIRYAGTYGTNGFYLPFTNTASTSTLVADSSGNGNNWTSNNISLTAGSTYDSLTDVPTLTSATVANYAVLNPLSTNQFGGSSTITNGNLTVAVPSSSASVAFATMPCSSKNYMETLGGSFGSGVLAVQCFSLSGLQGAGYYSDGRFYVNNVQIATYATFTGADVISCDVDTSTRQIRFYKNNTQIGSTATATGTDALYFAVSGSGAGSGSPSTSMNFGQQPFTYTAPSGFLPLNTFNI
jgi:hypothetical protein